MEKLNLNVISSESLRGGETEWLNLLDLAHSLPLSPEETVVSVSVRSEVGEFDNSSFNTRLILGTR